jgi:tetratricopeptide (TPR) repeat protein
MLTSGEENDLNQLLQAVNEDALVDFIDRLRDAGREDDAREALKSLSRSGVGGASHDLAGWHWDEGRLEEALAYYEMAEQQGYLDAQVNAGRVLEDLGRTADAQEKYKAAINRDGDVEASVNLGLLYIAAGNLSEAEFLLSNAAESDPRLAWQLGDVHSESGNLRAALNAYRAAVSAGESRANRDLGRVLVLLGEVREAERVMRRAVEDEVSGVAVDLAELLQSSGRAEEAEAELRSALDRRDDTALIPLANMLAQRDGQLLEAERLYGQAIEAGDDEAHHNLAILLHRMGRNDEARYQHRIAVSKGDELAMQDHRFRDASSE